VPQTAPPIRYRAGYPVPGAPVLHVNPGEWDVLCTFMERPQTRQEVAERLGVSREYVGATLHRLRRLAGAETVELMCGAIRDRKIVMAPVPRHTTRRRWAAVAA
jgi:DNA-binding CsgD family transcriptional regulator